MMSSLEIAWDQFVAVHPAGNILQTSLWGRLKADFGWSYEVVASNAPESGAGGALVLYKNLPLHFGSIAYIPRGPVVDWRDRHAVSAMLTSIESATRRRNARAIWLEPEISLDSNVDDIMKANGYRRGVRTIQPASTLIIDITHDDEAILARMKSKTRYNIRLAERKGVQVREGGLEDIDLFYDLMQETGKRDQFGIHSKSYYQRLMELFSPAGHAAFIITTVKNEPTAALLLMALGSKAWYIAGASSNQHRQLMPTYAAQWAAIRWAKEHGCCIYDLWGVPDADEQTLEAQFGERSDGLWGVYRFKRGFGGELIRYTGMWEKPLHPFYHLGAGLYKALNL